MTDQKIVKNKSKAYGYNYASLGDIVAQGFEIPEMRIKPTEFGEYIEFKDKEGNWQIGSKIVVPEMKGMNAAQAYGSALTYARRYTALMALALVCDDDKKLEAQGPAQESPKAKKAQPGHIDFDAVRGQIKKAESLGEIESIWRNIPEKLRQYFLEDCKKRKKELTNAEEDVLPTPEEEEQI